MRFSLCALEDLKISTVCSPANIQAVLNFLPSALKHYQSDSHCTQMMCFSDFQSQMRFLYKSLQEKRRGLRGFDFVGDKTYVRLFQSTD
jgi:hypothetical protein